MKRLILATLTIFIFMTVSKPQAGTAAGMSVGAATWYTYWDYDNNSKIDIDPTFLYGPVFSFKINDRFNMTLAFLYGTFDMKYTSTTAVSNYEMTRYDGDFAVNYRLNDYFKIFIGAKYTNYNYEFEDDDVEMKHSGIGTGSGLSLIVPVYSGFFFIMNAGGVYLWGTEKTEFSNDDKNTEKSKDYGVNTTAALAYYIEPASVTLSLGGRYQYIINNYEDSASEKHKFYGVTFSAIYSFDI